LVQTRKHFSGEIAAIDISPSSYKEDVNWAIRGYGGKEGLGS
jgi:hypothetical protein